MSLTQDIEPFEYTILNELISNLTTSDEESLGMCKYLPPLFVFTSMLRSNPFMDREDDLDDYWTADNDEPTTPPQRTAPLHMFPEVSCLPSDH